MNVINLTPHVVEVFSSEFPTNPIWSNRWTVVWQDLSGRINFAFPTNPIWSNRWTGTENGKENFSVTSFQLIRFEVIGEHVPACGLKPAEQPTEFPTNPIWSNRWTRWGCFSRSSRFSRFQLIRFEVIGERPFASVANQAVKSKIQEFPTNPIWSNRWTLLLHRGWFTW